MAALLAPGAGWANEPPCCRDCGDVHIIEGDFSGQCPTTAPKGPPPPGLERLGQQRKALCDDRSYRLAKLANGIRCVLIRDTSTDKAAAALCVGVGAYADSKDLAGLAHFLEHMLFQGTAKFPADNAYKQYVARHAGATNASTSGEQTCFQFDVVDEAFGGALDRFARFFREPLLLESCVDREMHAVDAEHSKNLNDDGRRAYQVLRESANADHPFSNFSTGNLETLKVPHIRDKLLEFWRDRYDPENMTVCLVSSQPLDDLEVLFATHFSGIRRSADAVDAVEAEAPPLFADTGVIHERKPVRDLRELRVMWPLPFGLRENYRNGAERVVGHALGHEGPRSLLAKLKAQGLAHALSFGVAPSLEDVACLSMRVELTEAGERQRYTTVLETCFEAIGALRRDLQRDARTGGRLWGVLAAIDAATFDFASSRRTAYATAPSLARGLHTVNGAHVLCGGRPGLCDDANWSPQRAALLHTLVASLADPARIIVHAATKHPGVPLETERWYGVEHGRRELTTAEVAAYRAAVVRGAAATDLGAPAPNAFLPDEARLRLARPAWRDATAKDAARRAASAAPPSRRRAGRLASWWKPDATFGQPKAYARCRVASKALWSGGARGRACALLWVHLALENLEKPLYDATCAGLDYDVSDAFFEGGVDVYVGGLAGGAVWRLLDVVCKEVVAPAWDADAFERVRDRLVRALRNVDKSRADSHASRWRRELCDEGRPTVGAVRDALSTVTIAGVRDHAARALEGCRALVHVHSSVDEDDVAKAEAVVEARFFIDDCKKRWPARRRLAAPAVNAPLRIARFSPNAENDNDSAVLKCYDLGARADIRAYATASLLNHVAKEPFFTQLRTREQLGYLVSLSYSSSRGRLLLVLRIQSQRVCADEVAKRIEAFLGVWRPAGLEDADFAAAKGALAKKWREPDRSMASEAAGAWGALLAPDADGAPSFSGRTASRRRSRPWRSATCSASTTSTSSERRGPRLRPRRRARRRRRLAGRARVLRRAGAGRGRLVFWL